MLNPYQKKRLKIVKTDFKKTNDKPNIISVFEHFDSNNQPLRRSGKATMVCCPFHGEQHPSLALYEDTDSYFCFACGAKGDSFNYIMQMANIDFTEAIEYAKDNKLYD